MAVDFPSSPSAGQAFTVGNVTWIWDGAKWGVPTTGGSSLYLPLTGGVMSGDITLKGDPTAALQPVTKQMLDAQNTANALAASYSHDNRVINGDMRIDQRNGGAGGNAVQVYTVDRWKYNTLLTAKGNWQRANSACPGFPYHLAFSSTSAYTAAAADFFHVVACCRRRHGQRLAVGNRQRPAGDLVLLGLRQSTWDVWRLDPQRHAGSRLSVQLRPDCERLDEDRHHHPRRHGGDMDIERQWRRPLSGVRSRLRLELQGDSERMGGGWRSRRDRRGECRRHQRRVFLSDRRQAGDRQRSNAVQPTVAGEEHGRLPAILFWLPINMRFNATTGSQVMQAVSFPAMRASPTIGAQVADPNITPGAANVTSVVIGSITPYSVGMQLTPITVGDSYTYGYRASAAAEL